MPRRFAKYIEKNPKIHSGMPIIAGTRVTVAEIIDYLETDKNVSDIIKTLKKADVLVTEEEIFAALDFAKYSTLNEAQKRESSK